jgi:predicted RNA binding protein YcfA (HicA-like mRNA interferase family)
MNSFSKPLKKLLADNGWYLLRHGRGDHEIWQHPSSGSRVTVNNNIKSRHTANAVLKQAGLAKGF